MQIFPTQLLCSVFLTPPSNQVDSMSSPFQLILTHVYEFLIQILPTLMNHLLMKSFSVEKSFFGSHVIKSLYFFGQILYHTFRLLKIFFPFSFLFYWIFLNQIVFLYILRFLCNTFLTEIPLYTGLCCIRWNI
jgi:hypothetical protein